MTFSNVWNPSCASNLRPFFIFTDRRVEAAVDATRKILAVCFLVVAVGLSAGRSCLLAQSKNTEETPRKAKSIVKPEYPQLARTMNLSGAVKILVVIAPDGKVKEARVIGGHPLLAQEAEKAAKAWQFEPGPKETTQILEFKFNRFER